MGERPSHADGKHWLGQLLSRRDFLVLYEHNLADLVGFRVAHGRRRIVCGEHELTLRNVRRNVQRDFANGCSAMVILVANPLALAALRRLLRRHFSRQIWTRVGVLIHDNCRRQLMAVL